jgi:predicted small lipoprotein YifL
MTDLPSQNENVTTITTCACRRQPRGGVLVAVLVVAMLAACGGPVAAPEDSLRQWVRQGQQAADDEDRRAIVAMISPAYLDGRGNSRDDIERILLAYFLRMNDVALITQIERLNIIADTAAELVLTVGMAGTHDGTLGFSADTYRFEMELELDGDDWLLLSARWGELGGKLH